MKLVIDRSKWLRGEGSDASLLRRVRDGKQCCLGFLARACGYNEAEITSRASPADLVRRTRRIDHPVFTQFVRYEDHQQLYADNSNIAAELMELNDSVESEENEREKDIACEFATVGVDVEFVDHEEAA